MKRFLIVEFGSWHDECLFSMCMLMKKCGWHVTLVANSKLQGRVSATLKTVTDEMLFFPFGSDWKGIRALWKFYRYLLKQGNLHMHVNTAQGSLAWKFFLLPLPKRINVTGTMHNIAKLGGSTGQRIITRQMDGYLLLNDILVDAYKKHSDKPFGVVYPIFYPKDVLKTSQSIKKPDDEVWITIPGAISYGRRNYNQLLPPDGVNYGKQIKFILLGNIHKADGMKLKEEIMKRRLEENFVLFDAFVPDDVFYAYVEQSDYVLPLISPEIPIYNKYLTEKISGTYNLSIAYRKPMLCPMEMAGIEDFKDTALFYDKSTFFEYINALVPGNPLATALFQSPKWQVQEQLKRLEAFIA